MDSDVEAAMQRLIDKDEIIDLVHRYSYCVDHRLYDEVVALPDQLAAMTTVAEILALGTLEYVEIEAQWDVVEFTGLVRSAGLLFHSAFEDGSQVGIVDFWPSAEAWNSFADGPLAEGMKAGGIAPPDDLKITPVLDADSR